MSKIRRHLYPRLYYSLRNRQRTCLSLLGVISLTVWFSSLPVHLSPSKYEVRFPQTSRRDNSLLFATEEKTFTRCLTSTKDWSVFHEAKINQIRTKWKTFISHIEEYPQNKFAGRGIVTSTRKTVFPRFLASLLLLRWLGSTLPIEVFLFPNELNERQLVELHNVDSISVRILNNKQSLHDRSANRYAIKLYAILQSRFEHILWLDADNIPVRDPEYLFDLPHYRESAAIFWPDFWTSFQDNPIWRILNISCRAEDYEQESGQLLINKQLSWKALHSAIHLNGDQDVMKLLLGDKDTFRLSWKALNIPFYFIRKYLAIAGFYQTDIKRTQPKEFCGHTMIQHDPLGEILFLHANMIKHHPNIRYAPEPKYPELANVSNPWRVLRRYANSASYLKASIFRNYDYSCTTFPTDGPPLYESDFHRLISPNITKMYLQLLKRKIKNGANSQYASIVL